MKMKRAIIPMNCPMLLFSLKSQDINQTQQMWLKYIAHCINTVTETELAEVLTNVSELKMFIRFDSQVKLFTSNMSWLSLNYFKVFRDFGFSIKFCSYPVHFFHRHNICAVLHLCTLMKVIF